MRVDIDADLEKRIVEAIKARYEAGVIRNVRVESVEVSDEDDEIRLLFTIETDADPAIIGKGYFGLTDHVRQALGGDWRDYFPILRPRIERSAAA
ncbi:MAG: hypothetical protein H5U20_10780 [Rhodobacteraceae bacterium]|nr:hypothetical protein [Paracoccaceae bacterium]